MARQRKHTDPGSKEGPTLYRICGLLTCAALLTTSVWLSGRTDAQEAGTQTDVNPFAEFERNAQAQQSSPTSPAASADVNRRRIDDLMAQAVRSQQAGQPRQALLLAGKAAQIANASGIKFSPFEKSPQQLIAEINGGGASLESFGPVPETVEGKREYVQKVLQAARQDIAARNFDSATQKIEMAKQVEVTYGVFDLQPDHVLVELARAQPASADGPSEALAAVTFEPTPGAQPAAPMATAQKTGREEALELVAAAKAALDQGNLKEARELALQAQQYQVTWGLFEEKPESVLTEVERRTQTKIIAAQPQAPSQPAGAAPMDHRELALGLLKEARELIKSGNLEAAKVKASEASLYQVSYGLFEDQPELVLQEIRNLEARQLMQPKAAPASVADAFATQQGGSPGNKQQEKAQALKLLSEARDAMRSGQLETAQQHLNAAEQIDVAYSLFDDTPEVVKEDLGRLIAARTNPGGNPFAEQMPTESREDAKASALALVAAARDALAAGDVKTAQAKAREASKYNVAYELFEDSPEQVLSDIESQSQLAAAPAMQNQDALDLTDNTPVARTESFTGNSAVVTSEFVSAQESFDRGVSALREGNRELAYNHFLAAYNSGEKLDSYRQQQLQDKLRELAPRRRSRNNIEMASNEVAGGPSIGLGSGQLDAVANQRSAKFDKLRTESLNAIFRAERMREKNPEQAVVLLNDVLAQIQESDLAAEQTDAIAASVKSSKASIEAYIKQKAPVLAMERQNKEVKDLIEVEIQTRHRVEQELALLVDKFNELMDQRRYAEAHAVAKQAKELDPENPVTVSMGLKSTFAMRTDQIEKLKDDKERAFYNELHDVELSAVSPLAGGKSIAYPANWKELKEKRQPLPADAGEHSPTEMRVRQSLTNPISLHFEGESLANIMQYISDTQGINVVVDEAGLGEEGVTSSTPVSIGVDGIQLRSALNLMLHPLNLDYTIENEVLNITSRMRQQGELATKVYRVADLVVPVAVRAPVSTFQPGTGFGGGASSSNLPQAGLQSMPSYTGLPGGDGFAQLPAGAMGALGQAGQAIPGLGKPTSTTAENYDFSSLQSLITTTVSPDSWDEVQGFGTIDQHESTLSLVIRQTQKVHQEIADLLDQLRRLQDLQVTIEVRFITVSDTFFEQIGIDFDFNVNDTVGGPTVDNDFAPLVPFGRVDANNGAAGGAGNAGGGGGGGGNNNNNQQTSSLAPFSSQPDINLIGRDNWPGGTVVGLINNNETFSPELDIPFRQGSFDIAAPSFGGFDPNAGIQFGMAILSDIEAFMFVRAAQGDRRSNIMFAPKLTLFNGQTGTVQSQSQRPFVVALIPVASAFNIGFQPIIQTIPEGTSLTVRAVVSADRRYVRLSVLPVFSNITDVFTFSFISGGGIGGIGGGGGGGGGFGQGGGGGALGGGGGGGGNFGGGGGGNNNNNGGGGSVTVQQPVVDIVTVDTVVSVPDGGTVLLGGVKTLREGRNMAGVPILNKIPYVSRLFKNTGVGRETESLMLMVTPRIIIQEEEEELLGIPN